MSQGPYVGVHDFTVVPEAGDNLTRVFLVQEHGSAEVGVTGLGEACFWKD